MDLSARTTYLPGLRRCLKDHPPLSVVIKDTDTEKPYYAACPVGDLSNHITILPVADNGDAEPQAIERIAAQILDTRPTADSPPWKIVVLPFANAHNSSSSKCFVAFAFSHALGDGISGLAFHKSFLAGLQDPTAEQYQKPAKGAMPTPFDTRKNLPISLSYLLAPALGQYLPKVFARLLGLRAAVSTITESTWLGNNKVFLDDDHKTGAKIFKIDGVTLTRLIQACRKHDTKLTALLHQIIAHALSNALPASKDGSFVDSFASQTAINMRHHVNVSNDMMGLYVSGFFDAHPRISSMSPDKMWSAAREMNAKLHECSNTTKNQSIGLLRFLISIRSWTGGHMGGKRDASYEISNLLAFDPEHQRTGPVQGQAEKWTLGNMFFAQPANVTGAPLCFNVVARKGGELLCTITWQLGAIGVGDERKEAGFVSKVVEEAERCIPLLVA